MLIFNELENNSNNDSDIDNRTIKTNANKHHAMSYSKHDLIPQCRTTKTSSNDSTSSKQDYSQELIDPMTTTTTTTASSSGSGFGAARGVGF